MELNTGATAWMLISASLVLLMTPALAFFYGGMSRGKSVLNMMMMSFGAMAVVAVIYVLWGWSMSYGGVDIAGIMADPITAFGLRDVIFDADGAYLLDGYGVPVVVGVAFQMTFAIITVALISGSIADRVKFSTWLVFVAVWVTVAFFPMAHMVWGGGILSGSGWFAGIAAPIDFAGGTVVHINAGVAALVLALVIGKRTGFGSEVKRPHNLPFVMLGAALLWFGWFGFNAGSAFTADGLAGLAWVNTTVSTAAAILAWLTVEKIRDGHFTSLGAASGAVAGLVAITPAAGSVGPMGAIAIGAIAGAVCALAVALKYRFGYDDSLDVVGVHLVGGLVGTVLIGVFSMETGLLAGAGTAQLIVQIAVALVAIVYSGAVTLAIAVALKAVMGWRVPVETEIAGIDVAEHGETAYESAAMAVV